MTNPIAQKVADLYYDAAQARAHRNTMVEELSIQDAEYWGVNSKSWTAEDHAVVAEAKEYYEECVVEMNAEHFAIQDEI